MSKSTIKAKEPRFHIAKRDAMPIWKSWLIRLLAIVAALVVCGIVVVLLTDLNPFQVYKTMYLGSFETTQSFIVAIQETAILLCISLAVTPAFKMRFWNIGAEGQVLMGGLATVACMILLDDKLPTPLLFLVMIVTSIVAGAIWAMIPAFFKANWNTNETLFTLMMNYVAIQLVSYFITIWENPKGSASLGSINLDTRIGWFPYLFNQKYLLNIIIVAIITIGLYIYLKYNKHGYEISVVGESENTARYVGMNVKKVVIRTMALSGAICGIAGLLLVAGTDHTLSTDTAGGQGFTAIMVSWLAKFNPLTMILVAFLIVFLDRGASEIAMALSLNESISDILTGIILFFIIGCEFFINYQILFNKKHKEEK